MYVPFTHGANGIIDDSDVCVVKFHANSSALYSSEFGVYAWSAKVTYVKSAYAHHSTLVLYALPLPYTNTLIRGGDDVRWTYARGTQSKHTSENVLALLSTTHSVNVSNDALHTISHIYVGRRDPVLRNDDTRMKIVCIWCGRRTHTRSLWLLCVNNNNNDNKNMYWNSRARVYSNCDAKKIQFVHTQFTTWWLVHRREDVRVVDFDIIQCLIAVLWFDLINFLLYLAPNLFSIFSNYRVSFCTTGHWVCCTNEAENTRNV